MIRAFLACFIAVVLTGVTLAADDDKPAPDEAPALIKKKKPNPDTPTAKDKKPAPQEEPKEPAPKEDLPAKEVDPKEVLERINKNIKRSEERLRGKDTGDGTRQVQKDVVKDIDALIERARKQQQADPSQGTPSDPKDSRSGKIKAARTRPGDRPRPGDMKPEPGQGKSNGPDAGAGRDSGGPTSKTADLFKDAWGHLPEQMRMEMNAYSREQFMGKYSDLLKQYYATIAEKGRRAESDR